MHAAARSHGRAALGKHHPFKKPQPSNNMKIIQDLLTRNPLLMERPSWLVTCSLKRRESFGTVTCTARYELAASSEDEARSAVREFVQQAHPRCSIESMQVSRQAWAHSN
jgi:hypothetical protein